MGWASEHIKLLQNGETIQIRPRGSSMKGKIESGDLCTILPIEGIALKKGDIVLCKIKGREYLHLISAIQGNRYQISNNNNWINGWITIKQIYGKCIKVEK